MLKKVCSLLAILVLPAAGVFAQCCSPGNPVAGANQVGILPKYTLRSVTFYRHSYSDTYYTGSEKAEYQGSTATFNYIGEIVSFGLPWRFTTELELGYFVNKNQINELAGKSETSGPSNGVISLKYGIFKTKRNFELTIASGLKFPFTTAVQYDDIGIAYPPEIQPSTGALGYVGQLFIAQGFPKVRMKTILTNRFEYNGTNPQGYKFGSALFTSLFVSKSLFAHLVVLVQFRNEYRAIDHQEGIAIPVTGGGIVYVAPQVSYNFPHGWSLSANCDIPVYRYYNGLELGPKIAEGLTLIKDFNLAKK
jgi:hypothetical protein